MVRFVLLACILFSAAASAATPGAAVSGATVPGAPADRSFKECPECPDMVGIPTGKFVMGSPAHEPGRFDAEGPQRIVTIKAFALAQYDVTSEDYLAFLRDSGYEPEPCNRLLNMRWRTPNKGVAYPPYDEEPARWPASCVSWKDANTYVAWLNKKVREARPNLPNKTGPYRLPSEAEWEYAARAGTTTVRWWGDAIGTGNANCNGCGSPYDFRALSNVDSFKPNPFGLYGMLGNVWQWTADCWHKGYLGAPSDGRSWNDKACTRHVLRGGSWDNVPVFVRSAARVGAEDLGGDFDYSTLAGFRIARDLP